MSDIIPSSPTTLELLDETSGRALVEAWLASGLNGAEFCRGRNLRPQRLHYWRERLATTMVATTMDTHFFLTSRLPLARANNGVTLKMTAAGQRLEQVS